MNTGVEKPGSRAQELKNLRALLQEIPKTEIHLHLEALATVDSIWELMKKHKIVNNEISTKEDLKKKFKITSLNEFIDLFINVVQSNFRSEDDIEYLIRDARAYLERNNIIYAEIFFAPSTFVKNGLDFNKMVKILDDGAKLIAKEDKKEVKFIIDVSRSFGVENARNNLDYTLQNRHDSIIGIGLGGAEAIGPARDYKKVFAKAIKNGFHVVAHAGEDVGPESIWDAVKILKVERIGHGTSAILDEELIEYLAEKQIPLEICPTSNLFTRKYVSVLEEHPIRQFFDRGLNVTVNTDDPTLFSIDLVDEYMKLANKGFFSPSEIIKMVKNNVYATFLPTRQKNKIWNDIEKIIKANADTLDISF
jgi:adenosine deaminase